MEKPIENCKFHEFKNIFCRCIVNSITNFHLYFAVICLVSLSLQGVIRISVKHLIEIRLFVYFSLGFGQILVSFGHFSRSIVYLDILFQMGYWVSKSFGLLAVGNYVIKWNLGIFPASMIIMLLTFTLSLLLYELMIKKVGVLRWLFGVKIKKQTLAPDGVKLTKLF